MVASQRIAAFVVSGVCLLLAGAVGFAIHSVIAPVNGGAQQMAKSFTPFTLPLTFLTRVEGNAPLIMIEFSDFQCPFCGAYARTTLPQIREEFIKAGKIRYAFVHFPLEDLHRDATRAAAAADCAGRQGLFWQMHDALFQQQDSLADKDLSNLSKSVGVNPIPFSTCMAGDDVRLSIEREVEVARKLNVVSTPSFFLGRVVDDTVQVTGALSGAHPIGSFRSAINRLMGAETERVSSSGL